MQLENLSNKQKLILDAANKINKGNELIAQGEQAIREGLLELDQLTGGDGKKQNSGGQDVSNKILKLNKGKKKNSEPVENQEFLDRIMNLVETNEYVSINFLIKHLKSGFDRTKKAVKILEKANKLKFVRKKKPGLQTPFDYIERV